MRPDRWRLLPVAGVPLLAMALAAAFGCGAHRSIYVDRQADFSAYQRVAVLPFQNMTSDQNAAEKVRSVFIIELLASRSVDVVDPGEVARVLGEKNLGPFGAFGAEQVAELGEALGADALIFGTVEEYGLDRGRAASAPEVSFTCKMRETASGANVWSASVSRGGAGAMVRLFGVTGDSITEATRKLVREALHTLIK